MSDGLLQRVSVPKSRALPRRIRLPDGLLQPVSIPVNQVRRRVGSACLTVCYSV